MSKFSSDFLTNLKRAVTSLYDRDMRLKINGDYFWIIEKDILERMENMSYDAITSSVSHTVLVNIPHTIPFTIRAKIF